MKQASPFVSEPIAKTINCAMADHFASFLQAEEGWAATPITPRRQKLVREFGTSVDVVGRRRDYRGDRLLKKGLSFLVSFGLAGLLAGLFLSGWPHFSILATVWAVVEISGFLLLYFACRRSSEYAWVECHQGKNKASVKDLRRFYEAYLNYFNGDGRKYKVVTVYFVAPAGFLVSTLRYAAQHNIQCFYEMEGTFVTISFYDLPTVK